MIRKIIFITLFAGSLVFGQKLSGIPGVFTDIGYGARPAGTGLAYTGFEGDVHSILWNPAGLSAVEQSQAAFTYTSHLKVVDYHYLASAFPLDKGEALGFALISSGDEVMREFSLHSAYSRTFSGLSVGVALKVRYVSFGNNTLDPNDFVVFDPSEIDEGRLNQVYGNAVGWGFDIGALYKLDEKVHLGFMLRDIYSPLYWNSQNDNPENKPEGKYTETVPFELVAGASFLVRENLRFNADYSPGLLEDQDSRLSGGLEGKIFDLLYLRGGTQFYLDNKENRKYSVGVGLDLDVIPELGVLVDFTYLFERLDNSLRFSLGVKF